MFALITISNLQFWEIINVLLVILIIEQTTTEQVWSGNVQFTDDGWLHEKDVRSIQHEIKVISLLCSYLYSYCLKIINPKSIQMNLEHGMLL